VSCVERLAEASQLRCLFETQGAVSRGADFVVDLGVGAELGAALPPSPLLGRGDQRASDPLSTSVRLDVPAFEISDAAGVAVLRVGADRQLRDADCRSRIIDRQQHLERFPEPAIEVLLDLGGVAGGLLRPERTPHPQPGCGIGARG
jgi:hypothetical protein